MSTTFLGLADNESRVYQALLELGSARVSTISKKAGLNRTTSYDILGRLMLYGLVAPASGEGSRKQYVAEHPTRLVQHLERQQRKAERTLATVKERLPELTLLYKTIKKPSIKFFEGIEGVKQIYLDTLTSKTEILSILDIEGWVMADLLRWGRKYNRDRTVKKIPERILAIENQGTVDWLTHYPTTLTYTKYKFIPKGLFMPFNGEINIYEGKVMIALPQKANPLGVLIHSADFANSLKTIFEIAWNALPEAKEVKKIK